MKALLIVAHGSPRAEANEPVLRLEDQVRGRGAFPLVVVGYLDCNEPDIPTAIELCVSGGAEEIVAVPWFLHSGRHFLLDLPAFFDDAMHRHPGLTIRMGDYAGHLPRMREVILARVREAVGGRG